MALAADFVTSCPGWITTIAVSACAHSALTAPSILEYSHADRGMLGSNHLNALNALLNCSTGVIRVT